MSARLPMLAGMSSRVRSDFGSLGDRVTRSGGAKHCLVDGTQPGIVWAWSRTPAGWAGLVAYVVDDELHVAQLPASRLTAATGAASLQ